MMTKARQVFLKSTYLSDLKMQTIVSECGDGDTHIYGVISQRISKK